MELFKEEIEKIAVIVNNVTQSSFILAIYETVDVRWDIIQRLKSKDSVINLPFKEFDITAHQKNPRQFITHIDPAARIIESHGFEPIKSIGDAVVFFGDINRVEEFIDIMLDLFADKRIADKHGFKVELRMVAHCGYLRFWLNKDGKKIDFTGAEGTRVFRLEKEAAKEELIVTEPLFQGLQPYLESNQIKSFKESNPRQLKGFIESPTIFYRLTMRSGTEDIPIDLKSCLERLREKTQEIDVLAGLYPAIDMEKNFINLRVESENIPEGRGGSPRMILEYHKRLEPGMDREEIEKPKKIFTAKEIFEGFNKGYIYGLPGAGKTTILRYFIYSMMKPQYNNAG